MTESEKRIKEVGDAFYKLTVLQRDNAWRECEVLREALRELTDAIDAFLSDNGEEEPTAGVAERLYAAHKAARAALAQQEK